MAQFEKPTETIDTETIEKEYLLNEFQKAYQYVDDIISGEKTIIEVLENPPDPKNVEKYYTQATNALRVEDYETAQTHFSVMLVLNNRDTRAMMGLAAAMEGQEQYEFAFPLYFMVIAITPYDPVAPFRGAVCLMKMGKTQDALRMFKMAVDCKDHIKHPAKQVYVDRAEGMVKVLANREK